MVRVPALRAHSRHRSSPVSNDRANRLIDISTALLNSVVFTALSSELGRHARPPAAVRETISPQVAARRPRVMRLKIAARPYTNECPAICLAPRPIVRLAALSPRRRSQIAIVRPFLLGTALRLSTR